MAKFYLEGHSRALLKRSEYQLMPLTIGVISTGGRQAFIVLVLMYSSAVGGHSMALLAAQVLFILVAVIPLRKATTSYLTRLSRQMLAWV